MKLIKRLLRRISTFDLAAVAVIFALMAGFFLFFYRRPEYVDIRVKITDKDVLYAITQPTAWYANRFIEGDVEKDVLGRKITEIKNVESFNTSSDKKAVYLDLTVRATYDTRTKLYSVKGKPLVFGTALRFNLSTITFDGIVTEFPNSQYQKNLQIKDTTIVAILRGRIPEQKPVEPRTLESIKVGDKILDSNSNVLAEVLAVEISPAERVTETSTGQLLLRRDPFYKDATLTLKVRKKVLSGEKFIFDNIPLKIGEEVPLNFENLSIKPVIIKIFPD